jgi:hypothetical protein
MTTSGRYFDFFSINLSIREKSRTSVRLCPRVRKLLNPQGGGGQKLTRPRLHAGLKCPNRGRWRGAT